MEIDVVCLWFFSRQSGSPFHRDFSSVASLYGKDNFAIFSIRNLISQMEKNKKKSNRRGGGEIQQCVRAYKFVSNVGESYIAICQ